tara:strand:- start:647 stop:979 length:333 start_codon:yes stop_codon:yes gene_type:complete
MNSEPSDSDLMMLITTLEDKFISDKISRKILESKLAACISSQQVYSEYWWEGEINSSKEFKLIMKTNKFNLQNLIDKIMELHPYDQPEIIYWPISSSKGYSSWLNDSCNC